MNKRGFLIIETIIYLTLMAALMALALSCVSRLMQQTRLDQSHMLRHMTVASAFDRLVADVSAAHSISKSPRAQGYCLTGDQQIEWILHQSNRLMRRVSGSSGKSSAVVSDGVEKFVISDVGHYTICRLEARGCTPLMTAIKR